jgi:hypothetical protein
VVPNSVKAFQPIHKIYPIGRLEQVEVNIDGVKTKADFEVIEIMDDSDPYLDLLGIDLEFDNNVKAKLEAVAYVL